MIACSWLTKIRKGKRATVHHGTFRYKVQSIKSIFRVFKPNFQNDSLLGVSIRLECAMMKKNTLIHFITPLYYFLRIYNGWFSTKQTNGTKQVRGDCVHCVWNDHTTKDRHEACSRTGSSGANPRASSKTESDRSRRSNPSNNSSSEMIKGGAPGAKKRRERRGRGRERENHEHTTHQTLDCCLGSLFFFDLQWMCGYRCKPTKPFSRNASLYL